MAEDDCGTLKARADMLHAEAREGVIQALRRGPGWNGFVAQVEIAAHCEDLAETAQAKVADEC